MIPILGIRVFHHYNLDLHSCLRNTCIPSLSSWVCSYLRNTCIPSLQSWVIFLSQEYLHSFITILSNIPILGIHAFLHYNLEHNSHPKITCIPSISSWLIFLSWEYMYSINTILSIIHIPRLHVFLHYHLE